MVRNWTLAFAAAGLPLLSCLRLETSRISDSNCHFHAKQSVLRFKHSAKHRFAVTIQNRKPG
jgi:hypothetical protein